MLAHQGQQTLPFVLHGLQLRQLARVAVRIHLVQVAPAVRGNGRGRFLGHVVRLTVNRLKYKTLCYISIKVPATRKPLFLFTMPKNEPKAHGLSQSERGIEFAT